MTIRSPIKHLGKSTVIYGLGNVLSKFSAFLLIPIFTRYLSLTEVGILALLEMAEVLLITIAPFGIYNAMWRFLPDINKNEGKQYIFSAFAGTFLLNCILLGLIALNYKSPALFFGLDQDTASILLIVILNVLLAFSFRFILVLWQYQQKPVAYVILSVCQFVGVLIITIIFVVIEKWGLLGVIVAKSVVLGIIFVFGCIFILKEYFTVPKLTVYWKMLRFGAPLILLALITPVLTLSDRFFLKIFVPLDDIAIYSIAYKFGMVINMVLVNPLERGWTPMMYKMGAEKESHKYYRDILFYYAILGAFIFLTISFFSRWIIEHVATSAYLSGTIIVPLITGAYFINGFRQFFIAGALLNNQTLRLSFASIIVIALNLILNYFFIKNYGILGAAWSTLISYLVLLCVIYGISQKLIYINWAWNRLIKLMGILGIVFFITYQFQLKNINYNNAIGLLGIVIFVVLIRVFRIISDREIRGVKSLIQLFKTK